MKKYVEFLKEEVGLRNLTKITKGYKKCEIYFHQDLDGVTSALAMKEFLKNYYQIEMVDCHIIQYGGMEFAIKETQPGNLPVLVDFAHSKPMFHIATDHHDSQIGGDDTKSTYYKPSRSNVETISGEIAYSDLFTPKDIELIQTVDSANFLKHNITPDDLHRAVFNYKKSESSEKNRFMMGFVVNRLLLAYKNKRISVLSLDGKTSHFNRNILECLVLDSTTSLYSIFNNIRHYINNAKTKDRLGRLASTDEITKNLKDYIIRMKDSDIIENPETGDFEEYRPDDWRHKILVEKGAKIKKGVNYDSEYKIITQYGGGNLFKPGSYDRYVPFKNFPDSEFFCIVWPMGLIQVSCNPFKEKSLQDINLGKITKEVLAKHENILKKFYIPIECIKREFEESQNWKAMQKSEVNYKGVGFKFSDLEAFYKDCVYELKDGEITSVDINKNDIIISMDTLYSELNYNQKTLLSSIKIPAWEIITRNSGGHPSITNISGINFLKYNKAALNKAYKTDKYTEILKLIASDFVDILKEKIDKLNSGEDLTYDTKDVELLGQNTNENFNYQILNKRGSEKKVSKEDFFKIGSKKAMNNLKIDLDKKVIATFERFNLK